MKTPNATDRFFSERLESYDSGAPMHLWDAIDQKRSWQHRTQARVKRNSWMLLLLFIGGAALGLCMILENENVHLANAKTQEIKAFPIYLNGQIADKEEENIFDVTSNLEINSEAKLQILTETDKEDLREYTINKPKYLGKTNSTKTNSTKTNNSRPSKNILNQKSTQQNSIQSPYITPSKVTQDKFVFNQDTDSKVTASSSLNTQNDLIKTKPYSISTDPVARSSDFITQKSSIAAISNLDIDLLELADDRNLPDPCYLFNKKEKKVKKVKTRTGPPKIYLDVLFSPDYVNRKLTLREDSDQANYLEERKSSEKTRYAYTGGLRLSLVSRSGFALRTGLMYAQINERFDYENGTSTGIVEEEIIENGVIVGYDTTIVSGTLIKTTFNRFHLIDVPAILGYELEFRRFTFSANAGVYFNLFFKKKGEILNENLLPQSFSSNNENALPVFRKTLGMSYFGSLGIHYKWKENLHILIEPHFRYYTDSFTRNDYAIKQNYWTAGVMMGLRYKF